MPGSQPVIENEGEFALAGVIEEQVARVSGVYSEFFDILEIENMRRKTELSHLRKTQDITDEHVVRREVKNKPLP